MKFAIFDIETRVDKQLLNAGRFDGRGLTDQQAYERYQADLRTRYGSDFFPLIFHLPVSIAFAQVDDNYFLRSVETLAEHEPSGESLCRAFWERVTRLAGALVSFNGRRFDIPVMELQALRHGIATRFRPAADDAGNDWEARHIDLYDLLSRGGNLRLHGGLDLLLRMIGMPGKDNITGAQVQRLFDAGRLDAIHRYCRDDVVRTYFLFIRFELMRGRVDEQTYRRACDNAASYAAQLNRTGTEVSLSR